MIGVFDSGFGGLTVLKELLQTLPNESFLYLGDTARLPYGTKTPETIIRYTRESCSFLVSQGAECIVIACNTASALALEHVAPLFPVPLIGVIDPIIPLLTTASRIGILGTSATIASEIHSQKILRSFPHAQITPIASPLLVSLIEEGWAHHLITRLALQDYLAPLLSANIDTLILACTHFPLIQPLIQEILGPHVRIINPALACAWEVRRHLASLNRLSPRRLSPPRFYVTDDREKFRKLGSSFLGQPIDTVEKV